MKVRCQSRAGAEEDRMDQVDGIGVISQAGKYALNQHGNWTAFPPVEEKADRRQRVQHANGTELVNRKHGRQYVVVQHMHDFVVRDHHACRRDGLKEVDKAAVTGQPGCDGMEPFSHEGAEHEDEQVMEYDVVQTVLKGVLNQGIG